MVLLVDGSKDAEENIKRVLRNDPALGVIRHADAGYAIAEEIAQKFSLKI
jgi:urocanate hydratase